MKLKIKLGIVLVFLYLGVGFVLTKDLIAESVQNAALQTNAGNRKLTDKHTNDLPSRMQIRRLGIDLPVIKGGFTVDGWILASDSVHYIVDTESVDTLVPFIYGHNLPGVLLATQHLQIGDILTLRTTSGRQLYFRYIADRLVEPTNTSVLSPVGNYNKLRLMTCSGIGDEKRRIMYFEPLKKTAQVNGDN